MALAQVDARHWRSLGQRRIDTYVQPFSGADHGREQAQLTTSTSTLAFEARSGQPALGHGAFDQFIADGFYFGSDGLEKGRSRLQRRLAIIVEGAPGELAGLFHFGGSTARIGGLELLTSRRVDGRDASALGGDGLLTDE